MPVGFPDYYGGLTLPVTVAEGGTGQTSVTSKALLYGAGTSKLIETNVGTSGQVLQIDSITLDPTFEDLVVNVSAITGILAVAHGGTGTATPGLVAGTSISVTGTWPNQTIANTSHYASLADPLPVAHGGTGTATPALTAGSNIAITGTWPANTIALTASPTIASFAFDNVGKKITVPNATMTIDQYGNLVAPSGLGTPNFWHLDDTSGNQMLVIYTDGTEVIKLIADTIELKPSGYIAKYANTATVKEGVPYFVAAADITGRTSTIGSTTLLTPGAAGLYRITAEVYLSNVSGAGDSVQVGVTFHQNSTPFSTSIFTVSQGVAGKNWGSGTATIYVDASTAIQYNATASLGASDSFDIHVRLEKI